MTSRWSENYSSVQVKTFTTNIGPTRVLPTTILQLFLCFFTDELMNLIANQSNLFAQQSMEEQQFEVWTKITVEEIKAYLGFFILMGLVPLSSIYDYWSTNPLYHYSPIADRISRDSFFEIHRYLHFVDNSCLPAYGQPGTVQCTL
jgi:hypothetical protein